MKVNPIPKPPKGKRKRAVNNSRPTAADICEVCGKPYAANHEIFFGRGKRQLSIKYGLQKRLCYEHHQGPDGPHHNRKRDLELKKEYQQKFIDQYGYEKWMELFQKNYSSL